MLTLYSFLRLSFSSIKLRTPGTSSVSFHRFSAQPHSLFSPSSSFSLSLLSLTSCPFPDTNSPNPSPTWIDPRQNNHNSYNSSSSSPAPPQTYPDNSNSYSNSNGQGYHQQPSGQGYNPNQPPSGQNSQVGGAPGQEQFYTDASKTTTSTQDRGFGKVRSRLLFLSRLPFSQRLTPLF